MERGTGSAPRGASVINAEMVKRLEGLLERVRARGASPRVSSREATPAAVVANETRVEAAPSEAGGSPLAPAPSGWSKPEADTLVRPSGMAPALAEPESVAAGGAHDSRERLMAAPKTAPDEVSELPPPRALESAPPIEEAEIEIVAQEETAELEEPPASSRRPVEPQPEERLAEIAFGNAEPLPPLHTPPPESGRLPAAGAAEFEQGGDLGDTHGPTPLLPRRMPETAAVRELAPDALRAQLVPSDAVFDVIADAQRFAPATFVALLDASLAL